jgi:hypothetical protein
MELQYATFVSHARPAERKTKEKRTKGKRRKLLTNADSTRGAKFQNSKWRHLPSFSPFSVA